VAAAEFSVGLAAQSPGQVTAHRPTCTVVAAATAVPPALR